MSVIVGVSGPTLTDSDINLLNNPLVTGVILLTRNYESKSQLHALTTSINAICPDLVIGVDQEGGRVQRFVSEFTRLPSLQKIGELYKKDQAQAKTVARAVGYLMAHEITECGIDFSFTPVLDLDRGFNKVIADRSFGASPRRVVELGQAMCEGIQQVGLPTIGKHFPGHGGVKQDTHFEEAEDIRTLDEMKEDLYPFKILIEKGFLTGIMSAHVKYPKIDCECAGFSKIWLQTILREELKFEGLKFSDCLTMDGAKMAGGMAAAAHKALAAGCDIVLICNKLSEIPAVLDSLKSKKVQPRLLKKVQAKRSAQRYKTAQEELQLLQMMASC